jgi:hypothetical protein
VFVVFRKPTTSVPSILTVRRNQELLLSASPRERQGIVIQKAVYGVVGDPKRTRDVRGKLQRLVDQGDDQVQVARMADGDDPAFGVVKTLIVDYTIGHEHATARATDQETIFLAHAEKVERTACLERDTGGRLIVEAWKPGQYQFLGSDPRSLAVNVAAIPSPVELDGPWEVAFPPHQGAPARTTFDHLASWSEQEDPGVKFFSGTATYTKTFSIPSEILARDRGLYIDLGKVEVMAQVTLNGKDLGILWKPPFLADITKEARPGTNLLEVQVVNLWINRMIGDEQVPEDSSRNPNGTLKEWPGWLNEGKPSPAGRFTFTTWRLWKKRDSLVPSGLLGPVRVLSTARMAVE